MLESPHCLDQFNEGSWACFQSLPVVCCQAEKNVVKVLLSRCHG